MTLIILFGLGLFAAFMLCFVLLMGRASAQGALLEQVTREARGTSPVSGPWRPVSADIVAKPFTALRRLLPRNEVSRASGAGAHRGYGVQ